MYDVLVFVLGQFWIGCFGGDYQDVFIFIDVGSWLSGRGVQVVDNVLNVVVDDFVGYCDCLFWIVGVVIFDGYQFVVFNVVVGVDVFNCLMCVIEFYVVLLGYWF